MISNLSRWAANMDDKDTRDYVFLYVWTMARILADLAVEHEADKDLLEGELTARVMSMLDRGRYKEKNNLMGWLFLQMATVIRDVSFELHRQNIPFVSMVSDHGTVDIEDIGTLPEESRFEEEIVEQVFALEDERLARVLQLIYLEDRSLVETADVIGVSTTTLSRLHENALSILQELNE